MTVEFKAYHYGAKMKAKKVNNRWMVGGDYDGNGALIMLPYTDPVTDFKGWAWHELRGAILKFTDYAEDKDININTAEWN